MARTGRKGHKAPASNDAKEDTKVDLTTKCPCVDGINVVESDPVTNALDTYICCDHCDQWWHCGCVTLKGLTEQMIVAIESWTCPRCFTSPYVKNNGQSKPSAEVSNASCTTIRLILKEELITMSTVLQGVVNKAKKEIMEQSEKSAVSYASAVKNCIKEDIKEATSEQATSQIAKSVVSKIDADNYERVKRESRVVINGIDERYDLNNKDSNTADKKYLIDVLGFDRNDIVSLHRAGAKNEENDRPRPLIIEMFSKEHAMNYCDNGKGLMVDDPNQLIDGKVRRYWINPDLCYADRQARYFARQERKRRIASQQHQQQQPATKK